MTPEQRQANIKRGAKKPTPAKKEMDDWNRGIDQQYFNAGGFCGRCGEACRPFHHKLPQELKDTACEYSGAHPDCGNHNLKFKERTPIVFGGYEIWECVNDNCDYSESL